jgi:predicted flap endonuclease-1-like 5' DNA nuclease
VRKIVPQPEKVVVEAARPVMPTRVSAAPKMEPKPVAAVEPPAPAAAPVVAPAPAEPVALMAAPVPVAEIVAKPEAAAPTAEVSAVKAEAKPKAAKPKAAKPAPKAKPAKAEGLVRLTAARGGKADDLKELEGVGPALEKLVNGLGFYHFDQIAAWTDADVALVDGEMKNFKGRIARDRWVAQANIIVTEGLEAFRERAKTNNY